MQSTLSPLRCSQALHSHLAASLATCTRHEAQPTLLLQQQRHRTHKMWHCCQDSNTVLLAEQLVLRQVPTPQAGSRPQPAPPPKRVQ
jgi:hypothetical protein